MHTHYVIVYIYIVYTRRAMFEGQSQGIPVSTGRLLRRHRRQRLRDFHRFGRLKMAEDQL